MKKLLSISLLALSLTFISANTDKVYICTGKYAKRYHNSICKGMDNCKGETKTVTIQQAKDKGLTPCGYCYGR